MDPPPSLKRKRDDGQDMSQFREVIDDETGERIRVRVDTTKSAKKRAKKTGGAQWQPTVGQIKAAEIWNKQEEKIRKDKEREEKRRKNAVRQAAKDAKTKEAQEELLRKGKITVEDTWGKVSASQNRLNRFFTTPQKPANHRNEPDQGDVSDQEEEDWIETPVQDIGAVEAAAEPQMLNGLIEKQSPQTNTSVEHVAALMLPPPLPAKQLRSVSSHQRQPSASPKAPKDDRLASPDPAPVLLSTQDVSQLFADIGSQDLEDDLMDDSEDSLIEEAMSTTLQPVATAPLENTNHDSLTPADATRRESDAIDEEDFDDSDVDDETLLYYAATQRVAKRARSSPSSEPDSPSSTTTAVLSPNPSKKPVTSPIMSPKHLKRSFGGAADSFAFTDVDDNDLVQCVEAFEKTDNAAVPDYDSINDADGINHISPYTSSDSFCQDDRIDLEDEDLLKAVEAVEAEVVVGGQYTHSTIRRRVLPWNKYPEIYAIAEGRVENVPTSPSLLRT